MASGSMSAIEHPAPLGWSISKTMRRPSGDQSGWTASPAVRVMRRSLEPSVRVEGAEDLRLAPHLDEVSDPERRRPHAGLARLVEDGAQSHRDCVSWAMRT